MIKKIDVPGDGNCMFWASMLSYLEPVKKDEYKLKERCQKIFNSTEHWIDIFNYFNNTNNVNDIKHLVLLFRINVIEYMQKNITEEQKNNLISILPEFNLENKRVLTFHNSEKIKTFEEYCKIMKKDGIYGDHYELFNISEFLNHNIIIFENGDRTKCKENINEKFKEKILLNYVNNIHYQYFVEELEYDSGYDSKLDGNNENPEDILIDILKNSYPIIEKKKKLESLHNKLKIINLTNMKKVKELENMIINHNQIMEKLELEIKDNNMVELIKQKTEIELEIQILNENINAKTNLISRLEKEIESNEENIKLKQKKSQNIVQNIIVLQDWRDSIWRRVIAVLTFGIFCSYKNVQKKIDKEHVNQSNIINEIKQLQQIKGKKIEQKKDLSTEILKNKEELSNLKENQLNLDTKLDELYQNINTEKEITKIKTKNCEIQSLLENTKEQIDEQQLKLFFTKEQIKNDEAIAKALQEQFDREKINDIEEHIQPSTSKSQSSSSKSQKV